MSFDQNDALYSNYLKFMEVFRGAVQQNSEFSSVQSKKREFTFSVAHSSGGVTSLLSRGEIHTLLVPENLKSPIRWKRQGGLTFMEVDNHVPAKHDLGSTFRLSSGNNRQIVDDFSVVQCKGFLETPESYSEWGQWLTEANRNNIENPDVHFYVVAVDASPLSGAIVVKSRDCIGIYGVATDPKWRKRGLGTLILDKILADYQSLNVIGLQVETDSYAHKYYRKLGFKDTYELGRFKK